MQTMAIARHIYEKSSTNFDENVSNPLNEPTTHVCHIINTATYELTPHVLHAHDMTW